jgi:sigma-E factor negative regulatory protein RseC
MEEVAHKGRIKSVSDGKVTVEILSESACSACHAKGVCSMGESARKEVEVSVGNPESYNVDQEVEVLLSSTLGHKAVWIAYVIPLILLVAFIMLPLSMGASEGVSALCGAAVTAFYYMMLYLFRKHLGSKWEFKIRNINK